jgi:cell division protease FtsH
MRNILSSFLVIILFFISLTLIFLFFSQTSLVEKEISFSEFIKKIKENPAEKIIVRPNNVEVVIGQERYLAKKEPNISFFEILKNYGFSSEEIKDLNIEIKDEGNLGLWLNIIFSVVLPILLFIGLFYFIFHRTSQSTSQIFSFTRSNIRLFSPKDAKEKITFKDVANLKEAKEELKEVVEFLKNPKKFQELGATIPRGVLLVGPPGSGKTLLARAVAGEANVPFFHISGSEFVEMFVGVGAGRVRDAFSVAKKAAPSILFIDEIDAIGRERGTGLGGGHDEREQTLNQILVEMDGFDRETRVIVIAATNRPDILDPALLRPGRFDRRVVLDLPDVNGREEILKIHARNKKLDEKVNLREIAERTPGFSGADLANLMNEAAILAARRNKKSITQEELIDSIEKVILGPERKSRVLTKKEKEITAYHEAGHALVSALLSEGEVEVKKISIIPRGLTGGYTMRMPKEEKYLKTKTEFFNDVATLLGGYIAEELKFKEISTGAANDLREATEMARALVTKYGMSKIGPVTFGRTEELMFLGKEILAERDYSEETAAKIDKEVLAIIKDCYKKAKKLLEENYDKLEKIAQKLIEKETLEKEEFEELIKN